MAEDQNSTQGTESASVSAEASNQPEPTGAGKPDPSDPIKQWLRENARWLHAELQLARSGVDAEARAELNP